MSGNEAWRKVDYGMEMDVARASDGLTDMVKKFTEINTGALITPQRDLPTTIEMTHKMVLNARLLVKQAKLLEARLRAQQRVAERDLMRSLRAD